MIFKYQQPIVEELSGTQALSATEYLASHILALHGHHGVSEEDGHYIVQALMAFSNSVVVSYKLMSLRGPSMISGQALRSNPVEMASS
jgi:hypothetical protein